MDGGGSALMPRSGDAHRDRHRSCLSADEHPPYGALVDAYDLTRKHLGSRARITRSGDSGREVVEGSLRGVDHGPTGTQLDIKTFGEHLVIQLQEHDAVELHGPDDSPLA